MDVKKFMSSYKAPERLDPRQALFGGRTNVYHLNYKAGEGETICYYDFTSLYPFVNARKTLSFKRISLGLSMQIFYPQEIFTILFYPSDVVVNECFPCVVLVQKGEPS